MTNSAINDSTDRLRNTRIRVLIYSAIVIAIVLTFVQRSGDQAHHNAITTYKAWRKAWRLAVKEGEDLHQSQLSNFIQGTPEVATREVSGDQGAHIIEIYIWSGLFAETRVEVELGKPQDDPAVVQIDLLNES